MVHGKKVSFNGSWYLKKPHFCPKCGNELESITVKKVVNSELLEAKEYDFRLRGHRGLDRIDLKGKIEFTWKELKCPSCNHKLTIDEMRQIEYENSDTERTDKINKIKVIIFKIVVIVIAVLLISFVVIENI